MMNIFVIKLVQRISSFFPKLKKQIRIAHVKTTPQKFVDLAPCLRSTNFCGGTSDDLRPKYDPGSAFNWSRLRKVFLQKTRKRRPS